MAYTEDQYQRAKAQLPKLSPEDQKRIGEKIAEYESSNLRPGEARGAEGEHPEVKLPVAEPKLSHASDHSLAAGLAAKQEDPYAAVPEPVDDSRDQALPTASKLKALARKAEVVGSVPGTLKAIALGTADKAGFGVMPAMANSLADRFTGTSYYEPSVAQFTRDQAPLLKAKGIQPGTKEFDDQFDEYKDRKWAQAHDAAEAAGTPLVRRDYVNHDTLSWGKLGDVLAELGDGAAAFGKSFLAGRTLQASKLVAPIKDRLLGTDTQAEDAAQVERHPYLSMAGELKGATSGPLAELTKAATIPKLANSTSIGARVLGAGIAGAAGGEADNASRAVAAGASDALHGENGLRSAKDQFVSHLLGSGLIGAGFGAAGQGVAEVANAGQKAYLAGQPGLGQLRRGGGDTDLIRGIRPGPDVAANLEGAREPLPGEDKAPFGGTPVEFAANKVREPLAQAHTDLNASTFERLGNEKQAAIEADPVLQRPAPVRATASKVVNLIQSKLQPDAPGYLPGMKLETAQIAPGGDVRDMGKLAQQLFKPRLVTAVEARNAAQANGGFVVDLDQAKQLGFDVTGKTLDSEGVPNGAPQDSGSAATEAAPEAPAGSSAEDIFGRAAEKPGPSPVDRLKPRPGRAFKTPVGEPGSDWFDKQKAAETVALHSGDYEVNDPFAAQRSKAPASPTADTPTTPGGAPSVATPSVRPTTPPVELRAKPSPAASQAQAAGLPQDHFKVVLEPQQYNAAKFEDILGDIDRKAGYAAAKGNPNPHWDEIARAIREDRKQFGPGWTDLIGKHHEELNGLEQRSAHAGFSEDKAHPEMGANAQDRLQNKLRSFPDPNDVASQKALREIAAAASPAVQKDLEVLGATGAFQKLKGSAQLKAAETLGGGGLVGRLTGVGGFMKPRADALARGLAAGPTGEPTITPRLHAFLNQVAPSGPGPKWLPGMVPRLGGGALGLKASVAYDALTPAQKKVLQGLLEQKTEGAKQ